MCKRKGEKMERTNEKGKLYVELQVPMGDYERFDIYFVDREDRRTVFTNLLEVPSEENIPVFEKSCEKMLKKYKNAPWVHYFMHRVRETSLNGHKYLELNLFINYTCIIKKSDGAIIMMRPGEIAKALYRNLIREDISGRNIFWRWDA